MGQATSSPTYHAAPSSFSPAAAALAPLSPSSSSSSQPAPDVRPRRPAPWRRSLLSTLESRGRGGSHHTQDAPDARHLTHSTQTGSRPRRPRSSSFNRLSQFLSLHSSSDHHHDDPTTQHPHSASNSGSSHSIPNSASTPVSTPASTERSSLTLRPSRLQRARTSINTSISGLSHMSFRRSTPTLPFLSDAVSTPMSQPQPLADPLDFALPDVSQTALDLDFDNHDHGHDSDHDHDHDHDPAVAAAAAATTVNISRPATPRTPSRRSSLRLPNGLSDRLDRFSGFRSDRSQRSFPRRRRSPNDAGAVSARDGSGGSAGEDNTALLSRLLSVAAAATAATLLEGNQQAIADARSVAGDGDDGTFNSFLQSLESGRLAAALRGAGHNDDSASSPQSQAPLNFFRMFRFGSPATAGLSPPAASGPDASSPQNTSDGTTPTPPDNNGTESRMVPIIIVGIRSVNPSSGNDGADDNGMPPFLDALSALPTTPFGESAVDRDSIDNILRSPQNGTHFTHRRRASMGGVNGIASGYDAQRHHRSPERAFRRPISLASDTSAGSRHPPPTSSANPSLSRLASPTPAPPTSRPTSVRSPSRRESIIRTTTTTTLESTSEDAPLRPRAPRQRRLSESDYRTTFSSRRNGIVEPDHPSPPSENTRSWIIYVLGGSYPENHPILTTPSLFTDSPTYEDMMLLSALLGPAKPPVASQQDVASAGGIFKIETTPSQDNNGVLLVAVAVDQSERVELVDEQRCLVCLCDFEADEEARQLVKCKHLFHKQCIDEWLTKGRNSCPLCRGQGVDEKEKSAGSPTPTPGDSPSSSGATSSSASFVDAASAAA